MKVKSDHSILKSIVFMALVATIASAATVVSKVNIDEKQVNADIKQITKDDVAMDAAGSWNMATGEGSVQFGAMGAQESQGGQDIENEDDEGHEDEDEDEDEDDYDIEEMGLDPDEDDYEEYDEDEDEDTNEDMDYYPSLNHEELEALDDHPSAADPLLVPMKKRGVTAKASTDKDDAKEKVDAVIDPKAIAEDTKEKVDAVIDPKAVAEDAKEKVDAAIDPKAVAEDAKEKADTAVDPKAIAEDVKEKADAAIDPKAIEEDAKEKVDAVIDPKAIAEDVKFSALGTLESGGSCIDSFVNFALRFREKCSIQCLRIMINSVSHPEIFGLLSCFSCSNFIIQGLIALAADCKGLLSTPMAMSSKSISGGERLGDIQSDVNPFDAGLYPLNFGDMMSSLQEVSTGDIQEWFDMGNDIYHAIDVNSRVSEGMSKNSTLTEEQKAELMKEEVTVNKDLFNQFIGKAASFADWELTPEILDNSGVYDRLHNMKII
ncbi:hypothetical protein BGZ76_000327 [Entomortierella beljakovae]|nr:hypothetical protein BGZ76_000327 [Entomortierella beljakovae]